MKNLSLLTRIRRSWNKKLTDRKGQSTTEYILILAIVVMVASKLKSTLINKVVGQAESLNLELKD